MPHRLPRYCEEQGLPAAGLSTDAIQEMLPCVTGAGPGIEPCPEVLRTMAERVGRGPTLTEGPPRSPVRRVRDLA